MRDYGTVSPKFWIGGTGKALRGNVEAQLVALYLMTSPHANMIGVFYCPVDTIVKETGLPFEGASKGLRSLIEADFCRIDGDTEEVFVCRMAAYQIGERLEAKDNRCKGVARELERVMSSLLQTTFRAIYSEAFHLPEPTTKTPLPVSPLQAPPKPETETGTGTGTDSANAGAEAPDAIWETGLQYLVSCNVPEKGARSFLGKMRQALGDDLLVSELLTKAQQQQVSEPLSWLRAAAGRKTNAGRTKSGVAL